MSVCVGCGIPVPPSNGPCPRKWCSDRCRKRTLYSGRCIYCGARTDGSNGRGAAPDRCARCTAIHAKRWTREALIAAIRTWASEHGRPPSATDWNSAMAQERGRPRRESGYPAVDTVQREFGSWRAGIEAAGFKAFASGYYGRDGESPDLCREYAERYMAGESAAAVAKAYGVPESSARGRIRRGGATMRSIQEAVALREAHRHEQARAAA